MTYVLALVLLLFGNNVRLIIENYQKYGILISLPGSSISRKDWTLTGLAHILLPLHVIFSFLVERLAKKWATGLRKRLSDTSDDQDPKQRLKDVQKAEAAAKRFQSVVGWVHTFLVIAIIVWPSYMSYYKIYHPFLSMTCLINGTIMFFKITSYALVHQDLRAAFIFNQPEETFHHLARVHHGNSTPSNTTVSANAEKDEIKDEVFQYDVHYPDNVTFPNMAYFWLAPTLCYQPSYPRTKVFRKSFFLKRSLEFLTCIGMMYFLIEQYATPTLQNSIRAVDHLDFGTMLERILKLSTTSVLIWLLMFYTFFHAAFNGLAEVRFLHSNCLTVDQQAKKP